MSGAGGGEPLDTLHLSAEDGQALTAALDSQEAACSETHRREHYRLSYHVAEGLVLEIQRVAGVRGRYVVRPHDISAGGIGFLHGSYLHTGVVCTIGLRTTDNKTVKVRGKVASCRHVSGRAHFVGVQFDEPIDVRDFVLPEEAGGETAGKTDPNASETYRSPDITAMGWMTAKAKILIVDDDATSRAIIAKGLKKGGLQTVAACSAREALACLAGEEFIGLLILDVMMPELDGISLLKYLRGRPWTADLPAIILTAVTDREMSARACRLGVDAYLHKPPDLPMLRKHARKIIRELPKPLADVMLTLKQLDLSREAFFELLEGLAEEVSGQLSQIKGPLEADDCQRVITELKAVCGGARSLGAQRLERSLELAVTCLQPQNGEGDHHDTDAIVRGVAKELSLLRALMKDLREGLWADP